MTDDFRRVFLTDGTVNRMTVCGRPMAEIVCQLADEKADLLKRLCELEMIAPRKIVVEGKVLIYRAPAHLIPDPI